MSAGKIGHQQICTEQWPTCANLKREIREYGKSAKCKPRET